MFQGGELHLQCDWERFDSVGVHKQCRHSIKAITLCWYHSNPCSIHGVGTRTCHPKGRKPRALAVTKDKLWVSPCFVTDTPNTQSLKRPQGVSIFRSRLTEGRRSLKPST